MKKIIEDVNLNKLQVSSDGRNLELFFVDMYNLAPFAEIKCRTLYSFNYQIALEEEGIFPIYVGEVNCATIKDMKFDSKLHELNFHFMISNDPVNPLKGDEEVYKPSHECDYLFLESADLFLEVLCQKIEVSYLKK